MNQIIVTVFGMLAAFTTAFLAEPVKIYFQNKSKLNSLRISLYRELWHNYQTVDLILNYLRQMGVEIPDDSKQENPSGKKLQSRTL